MVKVTFLHPCMSEGFYVATIDACDDSLKCERFAENDMMLMIINYHDSRNEFSHIHH